MQNLITDLFEILINCYKVYQLFKPVYDNQLKGRYSAWKILNRKARKVKLTLLRVLE